ncbi:MAG: hypothetical protein ABIE22_00875 [archaeon]
MKDKVLKDIIKKLLSKIITKQSEEVVDLLFGRSNVNEFLIAKRLGLTINQTRNILYRLSDYGLVSFIRKKDKRKGWYTYFWTLSTLKSLELAKKNLEDEKGHLLNVLKSRQTKNFYLCKTCTVEISEETALNNSFTCRECGNIYELSEAPKVISELKARISKIDSEVGKIDVEIDKIREKEDKRLAREALKIKKAKQKARKALRAKTVKKVAKKVKKVKKKVVKAKKKAKKKKKQ